MEAGARAARERALELRAAGLGASAPGPAAGRELGHEVGEAIPVRTPAGEPAGWFVPVLSGDRLAGFYQLGADLRADRYSALGAAVAATGWTDPAAVLATARRHLLPGEEPGEPFLSYDQSPSRLAWIVPLRDRAGDSPTLYVAGDVCWRAPKA